MAEHAQPSSLGPDRGAQDKARAAVGRLRESLKQAAASAEDQGAEALNVLQREVERWVELVDARNEQARDEARLQMHLGLMEAKERAQELDEYFQEALGAARRSAKDTSGLIDEARLQAHLARLDAADAALERGKRFRGALGKAKQAAEHPVDTASRELTRLVEAWADLSR